MKKPNRSTCMGLLAVCVALPGLGKTETPDSPPATRRESPASAPEKGPLSVATLAISSVDYDTYVREAEGLFADANAEDMRVWFRHLREDRRPATMRKGHWHACVNDVYSRLIRSSTSGLDLDAELIGVVEEAEDLVVRDYALQHLAILVEQKRGGNALGVLRKAADWRSTPLAGTALLNLYRLGDGREDGTLAARALNVAADSEAHGAARSTALQVGLLLEDERFLDPAVEIARRTQVVAHRVSALRVIAAFGGPEQKDLLLRLRRRGPRPASTIADEALTGFDHE